MRAFIDILTELNSIVNRFVWGIPAMVTILGVGLLLTIVLKGIQFRKFFRSMKETIGKIFKHKTTDSGAMTPFQAVCTALAATVGTGNIAGVAGALAIGGPGAIFWMWVSALLGMCTKFSEVTLAVHFRERNPEGDWIGGPMYYIKNGLGKRWIWLAYLFAIFGILAVFGTGNTTQVNTIVSSINATLNNYNLLPQGHPMVLNTVIGIAFAIVIALILLGGIKRIGQVTERLVPFMALLYILLGLGVIGLHFEKLPMIFSQIFQGAFRPSAVTGGIVGSIFISMTKGVSRGIFSNEAGLGTASIAHAASDTDNPCRQGLFGIFEVFTDTILICTITALIILCSGVPFPYGTAAGAELTINAFVSTYGNWVSIFSTVALCCFAFSTILGWGLYGARCAEFLFGHKILVPFYLLYSAASIVGATLNLKLIWDVADTFNGLMAIPNLLALAMLIPALKKLVKQNIDK